MIGVEVTIIDHGLTEAYAEVAEHLPDFANTSTNGTMNRIGVEILKDLQKEPGLVKLPIRWTSDRQRRYVMAMKRKGLIASPFVRSHGVSGGWKMTVIYTPGELTSVQFNNDNPATPFVEGKYRQRWHAETGWLNAQASVAAWIPVATDEIETDLIKAFYLIEGKNG